MNLNPKCVICACILGTRNQGYPPLPQDTVVCSASEVGATMALVCIVIDGLEACKKTLCPTHRKDYEELLVQARLRMHALKAQKEEPDVARRSS